MSMLGRRLSSVCVIAALSLTPDCRASPASDAEQAKQSTRFEIRIVRDSADRPRALELLGCPEETLANLKSHPDVEKALARMFSVHVVDKTAKSDQPAMLGTFAVDGNVVRFTPQYPLRPGMEYRVAARPVEEKPAADANGAKERGVAFVVIKVPEESRRKQSEVAQVFPSAALLPENQLRFYIHFSDPMSRGEAYNRIHLLRKNGQPIDHPFLELREELWDATGRRLTLLIDPGRIKQGLKPREDLGPVLETGHEYTLQIDAAFADATERPLVKEFRKTFKVVEPLAAAIDPAEWKIEPPRVGSTATLIVRFPRALDRALMERTLAVVDANGDSVCGQVIVGNEERRWEYLPEEIWKPGEYQLVVDSVLEDLAGNQIGRPFEVDESKPSSHKTVPAKVRIPFTVVRAPAAGTVK